MRRALLMFALTLGATMPPIAHAQTSGTPLDQNRTDRTAPVPTPSPSSHVQLGAATVTPQTPAAAGPLRKIALAGSSLPSAQVEAAIRPMIGKPIDHATLQAVATALSGLYKHSAVALYSITVPRQDFAGGVVRMQAIEGRISQVAIERHGKSRATQLVQTYADPLPQERPLTRPRLERQLSLIRDIPGVTLTPQLLQGSAPGDVVLGLDVKEQRQDLSFGLTTRAPRQLGEQQLQANLSGYGLVRPGDATTLSLATSSEVQRMQYAGLTHSEALGSDGLRLSASVGYLHTKPKGSTRSGEAKLGSLQLSYPLIRSYRRNLYLLAEADGLNSDNATFGLFTSTERTRVGRAGVSWSDQTARHTLQASGTFSAGSARVISGGFLGAADPHFQKANLRGGAELAIGPRLVIRAKAIGQLTDDALPASELLSLGGDEFGRAYESATLSGDRGVAGSLELGVRVIRDSRSNFDGSEVYGFADDGRIRVLSRFGLPSASAELASAGVGVRTAWRKKTVLGLEAAYGLTAPGRLGGDVRFGFNLRVSP